MNKVPTLLAGDIIFFEGYTIFLLLSSKKDNAGYTLVDGMRLNGVNAPCKESYCLYYNLKYDVYREGKKYFGNGEHKIA